MLYRNDRAHNHKIEAGNVLDTFNKMREMINVNDGTRSFSFRTVDCHDQPAPFHQGQYSQISLTHPDHFISDVDKGFLTFHVKLDLQLNTDLAKLQQIDDPNNFYKLFVGLKSSNQLFDRLEILHNNVNVGYQQNECVREGFLYSAVKPETEKKRRRFVHSLWENVSSYSQTIAGTYVNLNSFKSNGKTQVEFDLNVPFDDLLALQAFDLFPNGIIGDLSIRFQVTPAGLVWAAVDPYTVAETKAYLEDNDSVSPEELEKLKLIKAHGHLKHQFTQIGNEAVIPGPGTSPSPSPSPEPTPDPSPSPSPDPSPSPSPTPDPTPIQYKIKYRIGERWGDGGDESAGVPYQYNDIFTNLEFLFSYTTAEFERFGLTPSASDKQICEHNPDVVLPALQHADENGRYYAWQITKEPVAKKSLQSLKEEYSSQPATLTVNRMTITLCKSNMQGFGVCEATRKGIENILRNGLIIPSQKVDYHSFPIAPASNGIKSTLNIPLINATTLSIMFPKFHNDLTVFENPVYQNCFLNIGGKNYPDENVSTIGARFFEHQLTAGDLDAITLQCTKEFEDSMTMPKNDSNGVRYKNTLSDATSFVFNIQGERSSAGYCFDALDGGFGNIQIQVNGQPIYTGENDTYYNIILPSGAIVRPPPCQLWVTRDTYFKLSLDGLEYVDDQSPPGSQAE